jgi:hypothetical protein
MDERDPNFWLPPSRSSEWLDNRMPPRLEVRQDQDGYFRIYDMNEKPPVDITNRVARTISAACNNEGFRTRAEAEIFLRGAQSFYQHWRSKHDPYPDTDIPF